MSDFTNNQKTTSGIWIIVMAVTAFFSPFLFFGLIVLAYQEIWVKTVFGLLFLSLGVILVRVLLQKSRRRRTQQKQAARRFIESLPTLLGVEFTNVSPKRPRELFATSPYLHSLFFAIPWRGYKRVTSLETEYLRHYMGPRYSTYVEDCVEFSYRNRTYGLAELRVQQQIGGVENPKTETVLVIISPVDHQFSGYTLVHSRDLFVTHPGPDLPPVRLESPVFQELFKTYSSSQREARVCLKTNVMSAWLDYLSPLNRLGFLEFENRHVIIGIQLERSIFQADNAGRVSPADAAYSRTVIHHGLELAGLLNINHEYLYRARNLSK